MFVCTSILGIVCLHGCAHKLVISVGFLGMTARAESSLAVHQGLSLRKRTETGTLGSGVGTLIITGNER